MALEHDREACEGWIDAIERGRAYRSDITVGGEPWLRGQWADRLAAIDGDLAALEAEHSRSGAGLGPSEAPPLSGLEPPVLQVEFAHVAPDSFIAGQPLSIELRASSVHGEPIDADLYYRHVNHAEVYPILQLPPAADGCLLAEIPADYTASPYPLQY